MGGLIERDGATYPIDWEAELRAERARAEHLEARVASLTEERDRWEARVRAGVATPPPGYDAQFVPSKALRLVCEQRDRAEARVAALETQGSPGEEWRREQLEARAAALGRENKAQARADAAEREVATLRDLLAEFSAAFDAFAG